MTCENMEQFYKEILSEIRDTDDKNIINLIERGNEDFYLLCREFVKFAINAKRYKVSDEPDIQALYEFTEVDRLAITVQGFMNKHSFKDGETLLQMVENRYREALTNDELNKNAGFVPAESRSRPFGYVGKFYNFTVITCWDDIKKDILKKIYKIV